MNDILSRASGKRDFARWMEDLGDDDVAGMRVALKLLMIYEGGNDGLTSPSRLISTGESACNTYDF